MSFLNILRKPPGNCLRDLVVQILTEKRSSRVVPKMCGLQSHGVMFVSHKDLLLINDISSLAETPSRAQKMNCINYLDLPLIDVEYRRLRIVMFINNQCVICLVRSFFKDKIYDYVISLCFCYIHVD